MFFITMSQGQRHAVLGEFIAILWIADAVMQGVYHG